MLSIWILLHLISMTFSVLKCLLLWSTQIQSPSIRTKTKQHQCVIVQLQWCNISITGITATRLNESHHTNVRNAEIRFFKITSLHSINYLPTMKTGPGNSSTACSEQRLADTRGNRYVADKLQMMMMMNENSTTAMAIAHCVLYVLTSKATMPFQTKWSTVKA